MINMKIFIILYKIFIINIINIKIYKYVNIMKYNTCNIIYIKLNILKISMF